MSSFWDAVPQDDARPRHLLTDDDVFTDPPFWRGAGEAIPAVLYRWAQIGAEGATLAASNFVPEELPVFTPDMMRARGSFDPEYVRAKDWFFENIVQPVSQRRMDADERAKMYGLGGSILYGFGRYAGELLLGGPAGVAVAELIGETQTAAAQGKGLEEAFALGAGRSLIATLSVMAPVVAPIRAGLGPAMFQRTTYGVLSNTTLGVAGRGIDKGVLAAYGYDAEAANIDVLDPRALLVDGVLGTFFGLGAHGMIRWRERRLGRELDELLQQGNVDAAMVLAQKIVDENAAPKVPKNAAEMAAHTRRLEETQDMVDQGKVQGEDGTWAERPKPQPVDDKPAVEAADAQVREIEEALKPVEPVAEVTAPPESPRPTYPELKKLHDDWDAGGDESPNGLAEIVVAMAGVPKKLMRAAVKFLEEAEEDFTDFAGRGDVGPTEDAFMESLAEHAAMTKKQKKARAVPLKATPKEPAPQIEDSLPDGLTIPDDNGVMVPARQVVKALRERAQAMGDTGELAHKLADCILKNGGTRGL